MTAIDLTPLLPVSDRLSALDLSTGHLDREMNRLLLELSLHLDVCETLRHVSIVHPVLAGLLLAGMAIRITQLLMSVLHCEISLRGRGTVHILLWLTEWRGIVHRLGIWTGDRHRGL